MDDAWLEYIIRKADENQSIIREADKDQRVGAVCTENFIGIDYVMESHNVTTRCLHCFAVFWLSWPRHSSRRSA